MTLVLFIPHGQGCVLIADRQNTRKQGIKDEVTKIYLEGDEGPAIGCAGSTEIIQNLYARMRDSGNITNSNIRERVNDLWLEITKNVIKVHSIVGEQGIKYEELDIESLIIEIDRGSITPFYMHRGNYRRIDMDTITAIPTGLPDINTFLKIPVVELSEETAIKLGEYILRQMVFSNYEIGPIEYHGYDFIRVSIDGQFTLDKKGPTVKRNLGYSDILKILVEEEG